MADIFISYSRADHDIAKHIADALRKSGFEVFGDSEILAGDNWAHAIFDNLKNASVIIILLSVNSRSSKWVKEEVASALEAGGSQRIIPVLLDSEAKENWIWPLVADRQAIDLKADGVGVNDVVKAVVSRFIPIEVLEWEAALQREPKQKASLEWERAVALQRQSEENHQPMASAERGIPLPSAHRSIMLPVIGGILMIFAVAIVSLQIYSSEFGNLLSKWSSWLLPIGFITIGFVVGRLVGMLKK